MIIIILFVFRLLLHLFIVQSPLCLVVFAVMVIKNGDNLLIRMSSKISMLFFLQLKKN